MVSRLIEFRVEGLFGLYSYRIPLNINERITIIIGPNGRGKTVCLKLIEALFSGRIEYFAEVPFRSVSFIFNGGEVIFVDNSHFAISALEGSTTLQLTLIAPNENDTQWLPIVLSKALTVELRRHVPSSWKRANFNSWVDEMDGEELSTAELISRFRLPLKLATSLHENMPDSFVRLVKDTSCQLIETQRLLVLPTEVDPERDFRFYGATQQQRPVSRLAIQQKAEKLKAILSDTLTRYANLSQSLDRTFPLRVFDMQGSTQRVGDDLRSQLEILNKRREALMASGILDPDLQPVSLKTGSIEPGVAMALEIYVKDTVSKLDVFNDLKAKLDLFKEFMDERFLDKTIRIDRASGFEITSKNTSDVSLDRLSSGEQHQLILIFDLLFEVRANSLILIDEPELSLHVAWQRKFIESLFRVINLNKFDVMLATHSPAIVAEHFDLAVELAPTEN